MRMGEPSRSPSAGSDDLVQRVLRAIEGIHYGAVEIVIHDSRVVQIERREKLRFDLTSRPR
jgi:hypothetical protein